MPVLNKHTQTMTACFHIDGVSGFGSGERCRKDSTSTSSCDKVQMDTGFRKFLKMGRDFLGSWVGYII